MTQTYHIQTLIHTHHTHRHWHVTHTHHKHITQIDTHITHAHHTQAHSHWHIIHTHISQTYYTDTHRHTYCSHRHTYRTDTSCTHTSHAHISHTQTQTHHTHITHTHITHTSRRAEWLLREVLGVSLQCPHSVPVCVHVPNPGCCHPKPGPKASSRAPSLAEALGKASPALPAHTHQATAAAPQSSEQPKHSRTSLPMAKSRRIMDWWNHRGWERLLRPSSPTPHYHSKRWARLWDHQIAPDGICVHKSLLCLPHCLLPNTTTWCPGAMVPPCHALPPYAMCFTTKYCTDGHASATQKKRRGVSKLGNTLYKLVQAVLPRLLYK